MTFKELHFSNNKIVEDTKIAEDESFISKAFPNPMTTKISIQFATEQAENVTLLVYY